MVALAVVVIDYHCNIVLLTSEAIPVCNLLFDLHISGPVAYLAILANYPVHYMNNLDYSMPVVTLAIELDHKRNSLFLLYLTADALILV